MIRILNEYFSIALFWKQEFVHKKLIVLKT